MGQAYNDLDIIMATRKLFVDDNVDESTTKLCIHSLVEDRIYMSETVQVNVNFPQITIDFITGNGENGLPVEHGELRISAWYEKNAQSARVLCRKCNGRIATLLDEKPENLNGQTSYITVRLIDKFNQIVITDADGKLIHGLSIFDVEYKHNRS